MTSYLQAEEDYVPWQAAIKNFNFIKSLLTPTRPAYKYLQVGCCFWKFYVIRFSSKQLKKEAG